MRVGDPALKEVLPEMPREDLQWMMKLQGLDPTAAGDRWLWIAPPDGDLPAHYQPWKKVVRAGPGGSLIYLLEAPASP